MTQLIFDGINLPESIKGNYAAWKDSLEIQVEMISGRIVKEIRGNVWRIRYQYGYFNAEEKQAVLASAEKGRREPIYCAFLPPHSNEYQTGYFFVTSITYPRFMWSSEGEPLWANFAVELREVSPHD